MDLKCLKRLASVAVVVIATVLAAAASGQAPGMSSHGSHPEESEGPTIPTDITVEAQRGTMMATGTDTRASTVGAGF